MTWKSTVFVSGAGLLATWLASVPSPSAQPAITAPKAAPSASAGVSSSIAYEADRLERRNRSGDAFNAPSRNLFRFAPARPSARPASAPVTPPVTDVAPASPGLTIRLSGVAMDRVGDSEVWTAIFGTPSGVVLARTG